VEKQIGHVMSSGIESAEFVIEHMGQPCQRMPIASVSRGEGPANVFPGQPPLNVDVVSDIQIVIQADKGVVRNLPVRNEGQQNQQARNNEG